MITDPILHVLWSRAVGTPTYVKAEWLALEATGGSDVFGALWRKAQALPDYWDVDADWVRLAHVLGFKTAPRSPSEARMSAPERSLEEQVNLRLAELEHCRTVDGNNDKYLRLWNLSRIYRVISGHEQGWVDLPADVAATLNRDGVWAIKNDPNYWFASLDRGGSPIMRTGGHGAEWSEVRAAVDAAARRILQPAPTGTPLPATPTFAEAKAVFDEAMDKIRHHIPGASIRQPSGLPPAQQSGWTMGEIRSVTVKCDPFSGVCERARTFLGTLEYLPLADERTASELRHRLRTPSPEVLKEATLFISGVHPAREGQRELLEEMRKVHWEGQLDHRPEGRTLTYRCGIHPRSGPSGRLAPCPGPSLQG